MTKVKFQYSFIKADFGLNKLNNKAKTAQIITIKFFGIKRFFMQYFFCKNENNKLISIL